MDHLAFSSSLNVAFRLCLNLRLDLVFFLSRLNSVFAFVGPSFLHCSVPSHWSPQSQRCRLRHLRRLRVRCPTHPPHGKPHENPHQTEEGGRGGALRHGDVPGGGRSIGGERSEFSRRCWSRRGSPWPEFTSWKGMEAWETEGHRSGDALGPEDLGIVPRS